MNGREVVVLSGVRTAIGSTVAAWKTPRRRTWRRG
jgi:hypothetical protein